MLMFPLERLNAQYVHYSSFFPPHRTSAQYAPDFADPLYCMANPALMSSNDGLLAAAYMEKRYLSTDLMLFMIAASRRFDNSNIVGSIGYFGGPHYHEKHLAVNYGKNFDNIQAGLQLAYHQISTPGERILNALETAIAANIKLSNSATGSFRIVNMQSPLLSKDSNLLRPAAAFHLGIGFSVSQEIYLGFESQKQEGRLPDVAALVIFDVATSYRFRLNWSTRTGQPYFAAAWKMNNLSIEAGLLYHIHLGISPAISIILMNTKK